MRRRDDFGDGDPCPIVPEHGRMHMIQPPTAEKGRSPRQYCPEQSHDGATPNLFEYDGVTPVRRKK